MRAEARSYNVSMVTSVNNLSRKEAVTHQVLFLLRLKGDVQQKKRPQPNCIRSMFLQNSYQATLANITFFLELE